MFDLNNYLKKLIRTGKLTDVMKVQRIGSSRVANEVALRSIAPPETSIEPAQPSTLQGSQRPLLTDTDALTRKVREEMVRDARAAFAAVMAELKASHLDNALDKQEETEDAILSQHHIQIDHVGEA